MSCDVKNLIYKMQCSGYEQDTNDPTMCNDECLVSSVKVLADTTVQVSFSLLYK